MLLRLDRLDAELRGCTIQLGPSVYGVGSKKIWIGATLG
jgi:hypothetical protein